MLTDIEILVISFTASLSLANFIMLLVLICRDINDDKNKKE